MDWSAFLLTGCPDTLHTRDMNTTITTATPLTAQSVSRALRKANVNIAPAGIKGLHASKAVLGQVCITADHDLDAKAARASKFAEEVAQSLGYTVRRITPTIFYVARKAK